MATTTVLVVEDDAAIRRGLVDALSFAGFEVLECADGDSAMRTALVADIDLILLDLVLPEVSGLSILERVREQRPTLPVILVTARGAEEDRVQGLKLGADDYVVKPFSARELLARVEAVLRRSPARVAPARRLRVADREIQIDTREVRLPSGECRQLSEKEADILRYLAAFCGRTVSRDELLNRVWGLNPRGITTRTVDMHIARLRDKLDDSGRAEIIRTIRSKGYMLAAGAEIEAS